MASAASKGSYYKARTKDWLERHGYTVAHLERVMWLMPRPPQTRMVPVKKDQLGADLLAVSESEVLFVQVKGGTAGRSNLAAGIREFARHPCPPGAKQWVVVWEPRAREPLVVDAREYRANYVGDTNGDDGTARKRRIRLPRTTLF